MPNLLSPLFSRWEVSPPIISATEANHRLKDVFSVLQACSLLRKCTSSESIDCPDCSRRYRVEYLEDSAGAKFGYIDCPVCGQSKVPPNLGGRWEIDTPAMLSAIFQDAKLDIAAKSEQSLWYIGKATWAGRSRQLWLALAFRRDGSEAAVEILRRNPKSIVFAPTNYGADRWQTAANNFLIPLEAVVSLDGDQFILDIDDIEGRIIDAGMGPAEAKKPASRKRGVGPAAKIEALTSEVIKFLQAARDYAFDTKARTGEPKLLRRYTKKKFCELAGIEPYDFSRCNDDEAARELKIYWEMTSDLNKIMEFGGRISRGRKT